LIKKLWTRFDGMNVICVCEPHMKKCEDKKCQEFVVSFTEICRKNDDDLRSLDKSTRALDSSVRRFQSEVARSIRKMKKVKV
jgi:hypothetical protein